MHHVVVSHHTYTPSHHVPSTTVHHVPSSPHAGSWGGSHGGCFPHPPAGGWGGAASTHHVAVTTPHPATTAVHHAAPSATVNHGGAWSVVTSPHAVSGSVTASGTSKGGSAEVVGCVDVTSHAQVCVGAGANGAWGHMKGGVDSSIGVRW